MAEPAPRPAPRGILKTAATQWARKEAQRTALVTGLNREVVLKVLVLGGDGVGKSSLIGALAGGAAAPRGARHEPTHGVECTTVRAATLRGVPVYVQLCEAPLSSLRAPAHIRAGGVGEDATAAAGGAVSKLQSDVAFSGVHAVALLVDAGGDAAAGPGQSLAAADWLREALGSKLLARLPRTRHPHTAAAAAVAAGTPPFPVLLVAHKVRAALLFQEQWRQQQLGGGGELSPRAGGFGVASGAGGSGVAGAGPSAAAAQDTWRNQEREDRYYDDEGASSAEGGPLRPVSATAVAAPRQQKAAAASVLPAVVSSGAAGDGGPRQSHHKVRYGNSGGGGAPSPPAAAAREHSECDAAAVVGGLTAVELRQYAAAAGFTGGLWLTAARPLDSEPAGEPDAGGPRGAPPPVWEHSAAAAALRQASVQQLLTGLVEMSLAHWGFFLEQQVAAAVGAPASPAREQEAVGGDEQPAGSVELVGAGDGAAGPSGTEPAPAAALPVDPVVNAGNDDESGRCCELALLAGGDGAAAAPGDEPPSPPGRWSDCRARALAQAGFPHARVPRVSARLLREQGLRLT